MPKTSWILQEKQGEHKTCLHHLDAKERNSKELLSRVKSHMASDNEWFNIPNLLKERDRRTNKLQSDKV
ncbi:hypothetical protein SteCoe_35838 [Stentor coeruleus]|uniref:Uncharacterized protein n=1 Tax=Stentor coeruleus TaxID=5963 RepID=A0A1R2ARM6_9CILI|nr:hypothetical protein SteCoe_35838 [Stentor coeruleus]